MTDFAQARRSMVENQLRATGVTDKRLLAAMLEVPRERFVPAGRAIIAYADADQPLPGGRWLAAPSPFARLVQLAEIVETDTVLDVGAASGYSAAVLAAMAAEVTGLESDADLADVARRNLTELGVANARLVDAALDGSFPLGRTFDAIVIEGAVAEAPAAFFPALADGGRLVALVGRGGSAVAHVYVRAGDEIAARTEFNATLPALPVAPPPPSFVF